MSTGTVVEMEKKLPAKRRRKPVAGKTGNWTKEEDQILLRHQKSLGNKWTEISKVLEGRTDNAVKNRFATLSKQGNPGPKRNRSAKAKDMSPGEDFDSSASKRKAKKCRRVSSSFSPNPGWLCGPAALSSDGMPIKAPLSHADYAQIRAAQRGECLPAMQDKPSNPLMGGRGHARAALWAQQPPLNSDNKEQTPPSDASTEDAFPQLLWPEDSNFCQPQKQETRQQICINAGYMAPTFPNGYLPDSDMSSSSCGMQDAWNGATPAGWLTETLRIEEIDELLPELDLMFPEFG